MLNKSLADILLKSSEPSVRFKTRTMLLDENPDSAVNKKLRIEIKNSPRVKKLLDFRDNEGKLKPVKYPYQKWSGVHWVLVHLAELCYPAKDKSIYALRDQVYEQWLSDFMIKSTYCTGSKNIYGTDGVPVINGRYRRCASQQGNALYSTVSLGIEDGRAETLADLLLKWQWSDGGWNCDKNPEAHISSFTESLIPLRGLAVYNKKYFSKKTNSAINNAAEIFLKRNLFKRISTGKVIHPSFLKLHYPCYWHYDILFGLKVMAEAGFIKDVRCKEALDLLESMQLKSGGWSSGGKYYKYEESKDFSPKLGYEKVNWSSGKNRKLNEWITLVALFVLKKSGRIEF